MQKISFMTLGCPRWDLDTICSRGQAYGFDGIDFRGYLDEIDITRLPEFTTGAAETRRKLLDAGLAVSGISSSIWACVPEALRKNLEEARRTIAVAKAFDVVNIRIFGGGDLEQFSREELAKFGHDCIARILQLDGAADLKWLFETHDNWVKAEHACLLLDTVPSPAFGALWDMGHTWRVGYEKPVDSFAALGSRVGYTHVKDAVYEPDSPLAMQDGWHYVAPGTGELPLAESLSLLAKSGYDGWFVFEHEKRWHPNLAEPEEIFPQFVSWIRQQFSDFD
ncbi:MAG: sugar phosphate isomerase/epimerase [Anaerolineales bacterium]|nr:sugar phosphate isomerase/epimerase [Anaerolineales bacterium]